MIVNGWVQAWISLIFAIMFLPTLAACKEQSPMAAATDEVEKILPTGTEVSLTLTGYNYTNRYIDQFSADGQGGGNLHVSGPAGGGGGSACCVGYVIGARPWKLAVRWQADACTFNEGVFSNGEKHHEIYSFFKEAEVQMDPHIPAHPRYLEVHFYPDGHVEAAITEHSSPPRMELDQSRENKTPFKQCPNNIRPEK